MFLVLNQSVRAFLALLIPHSTAAIPALPSSRLRSAFFLAVTSLHSVRSSSADAARRYAGGALKRFRWKG